MTPEQYRERDAVARVFQQQAAVTPVEANSLRGCLMMAVQMAHVLKLNHADLQKVVTEEAVLWEEYLATRLKLIEQRKAKAKKP